MLFADNFVGVQVGDRIPLQAPENQQRNPYIYYLHYSEDEICLL